MKTIKYFSALLLVLFSTVVFASSLGDAKKQGLVGENDRGYVGIIVDSPQTRQLVDSVNAKRKAAYMELAKKNNIPLSQVEALAAEKTYAKTRSGNYIWKNGRWVKK